ncbi:MAG: hypothetical protein GQ527_07725 [Bacteroidales bacterium]|nr:hypothetical protein [Bacteroidales bacterium]
MKIEFRINLPHIYIQDAIYSIDFRLADSIPFEIYQKYSDLKRTIIRESKKHLLKNLYNDHIDSYLDNSSSLKDWLNKPLIRNEVASAIHYYDKVHYKLIAFCIMPNHVHLIINTNGFKPMPLGDFMGSIKRYSARKANILLGREGKFWQTESYDHILKSRNDLADSIDYVINNPVKAGLVAEWNEWPGTYLNEKYFDAK